MSKRIVKVGEVLIRKRQVTKQDTLDVELITENVTVKNTDSSEEV